MIEISLAARVEHRLMDPLTLKPRYGARSRIINALLRRWLSETPDALDLPALTDAEIDALAGENHAP